MRLVRDIPVIQGGGLSARPLGRGLGRVLLPSASSSWRAESRLFPLARPLSKRAAADRASASWRSTHIRVGLALFASLLGACGGDDITDANGDGIDDGVVVPNNVTVVTPTKPLGFVGGEIRNALDDQRLSGARVSLFGGGLEEQVSTNGDGAFQLGPIPAGAAFLLRVEADGFTDATLGDLQVDDSAGNFPTANGALFVGPIALVPTTGRFSVQVVSVDGEAVQGARVTIETAVRFLLRGVAQGTETASAITDVDGLATWVGLPDVRLLPPHLAPSAALVINVLPVDRDGDGALDLRGATVEVSGEEVRSSALPPVVVLRLAGSEPLEIVASNVTRFVSSTPAGPSVLEPSEGIRVVFNKPIVRESVLVDLRDETGTTSILAPFVIGTLGNVLTIDPAEDLMRGREYNIALRVDSTSGGQTESISVASPLFGAPDPAAMITTTGRFRDNDMNNLWGTGPDTIELAVSVPIGRAGVAPAFRAKVFLELDLDDTSTIGDGLGELPQQGEPYPQPLSVSAAEPLPPNGAGLSGFTRTFAPIPVRLRVPRTQLQGGVSFEVRIEPGDNDGRFVTDVGGKAAPLRAIGTALLQ